MASELGWLRHTCHGALAGLKKKRGLRITSDKHPGGERVYQSPTLELSDAARLERAHHNQPPRTPVSGSLAGLGATRHMRTASMARSIARGSDEIKPQGSAPMVMCRRAIL
jgi:hypothetical protein